MKTRREGRGKIAAAVISMDRTYPRTESWIRERGSDGEAGKGRDAGIASGGQASRQESRYFRQTRAYLRAPRQAGSIRSIFSRPGERYTLTGLMDLLASTFS